MPAFVTGVNLKESDLKVIVVDPLNPSLRIDPFSLTYDMFQINPSDQAYQILPGGRTPARWDVGYFFVDERIHPLSPIGEYEVRWNLRRTMTSPLEVIPMRFSVVGVEKITNLNLTEVQKFLIHRLRILLRDNNPDKYYKFQPPTPDAELQGFTQVYGYIFDDSEILAHLQMALNDVNLRPPFTTFTLDEAPTTIISPLLTGAAMYALSLSVMWAGESFSYSISSVSLDVNKASEYSAQRDWFQQQYQDVVKEFKRGIFFTVGLRQPMYSIGMGGSRLGPYSKQGTMSARNWSSSTRPEWG